MKKYIQILIIIVCLISFIMLCSCKSSSPPDYPARTNPPSTESVSESGEEEDVERLGYWDLAVKQLYSPNIDEFYFGTSELFSNASAQHLLDGLTHKEPIVKWFCARMLPSVIDADMVDTLLTPELALELLLGLECDNNVDVQTSAELAISIIDNTYKSDIFFVSPDGTKALLLLFNDHIFWIAEDSKLYNISGDLGGRTIKAYSWSPDSRYIPYGIGIHHGNMIEIYDTLLQVHINMSGIYYAWDYVNSILKEKSNEYSTEISKSTAAFYDFNGWLDNETIMITHHYVVADKDYTIETRLYYDIVKQKYIALDNCVKVIHGGDIDETRIELIES